jgi:hypothetical protein
MTDKKWKAHERESAKIIGGKRQPSQGIAAADIIHDRFLVEHKSTKVIPKWLKEMLAQVFDTKSDLIPLGIVVMHREGKARLDRMAVLRLEDLAALTNLTEEDFDAAPPAADLPADHDPAAGGT